MKLTLFKEIDFLYAVKALFKELKVPVNYVTDEPTTARQILKDTYKENSTFALVDEVYFVGMIDDAAFEGNQSLSASQIKSDYDGILIFGITLNQRDNNLLPTRSQLAEISRAFNREFYYTPVVLVFKYRDNISDYLAFANAERLKYKQEWREGEKTGKVSLLRDINIKKPHRGHEDIINQLKIPTSGTKQVDSFTKLYNYWQEVFSVSILNKKFYQELQNWYFWAIKEVSFPNQPKILDENIDGDEAKLKEAIKEHKGKNVIRLLTRILFIWFIKEKKLIPEEIFDEQTIADKLIDDFTPQKPHGVFSTGKHNSKYYRAILQNLFFATLNQEMGKRTFRNDKQHQNVTNLMRYKSYFKDPAYFVNLMEDIVPFMNGGLFECLDKPHPDKKGKQGGDIIIYTDGFSDRADNFLEVPDYLFFDVDEDVDLSDDFGSKAKVYKNAKTRGLLEILKSYKFTITENTPIEEDVALDPELLGKVFENLLASYNPETKTTARKQTGSFYTPREIVNYMVDESLIAYLKNAISPDSHRKEFEEEELDKKLHQLFSFDETNPFKDYSDLQKQIIKALDNAKILDPAAGSGAFPMGVLQKMVHVLHKVDPQSTEWKQRQIDKVNNAIESLETIDDEKFREQSIKELKSQIADIEDAFENNELDYGRKLFLIENCIYGVDIQSIATQISKLRFFISLIVDQKIDKNKANFGVRPLPNLETKFVAANTLIGIDKPDAQLSMFDNTEVKKLEAQLKKVRHKIFSSKSPKRKRELREEDKNLREQIANLLEEGGMENLTARQLASWDPYDQNASSPFFDPEWMFDIAEGFDVVIGNPPYINIYKIDDSIKSTLNSRYNTAYKKYDIYVLFFEQGLNLLKEEGILILITSNKFFSQPYGLNLRNLFLEKEIIEITNFRINVFDATVDTAISIIKNKDQTKSIFLYSEITTVKQLKEIFENIKNNVDSGIFKHVPEHNFRFSIDKKSKSIIDKIEELSYRINEICYVNYGCRLVSKKGNKKKSDYVFYEDNDHLLKAFIEGQDIKKYQITNSRYVDYKPEEHYLALFPELFESQKIVSKDVVGKSGMLQMAFDEKGIYNDHTVVNAVRWCDLQNVSYRNVVKATTKQKIEKSKTFSYLSILGFLNSKLTYWYFDKIFNIDLHFYPNTFQNMLIYRKKVPAVFDLIIKMNIQNISNTLISVIDSLVFNLYFPDHMKERGIDVLEFVERDIELAMRGRSFEEIGETEKEEIIEQLHQTWTDPNNEVVKRMAMFKEKSPDILKPILES